MAARLKSVGEAAQELNVSKDLLRRLIKKGSIRAVRISKRILVAQTEIDRIVANGLQVGRRIPLVTCAPKARRQAVSR